MKIGVLTVPLYGLSTEDAFAYLHSLGVQAVELGAGGFPGSDHLHPEELLADDGKLAAFSALLDKYELTIDALSCHGNPVHPNKEIADKAHEEFVRTCRLAQKLGVDTVVTFSGCPGDCEQSQRPNWVTCAWPVDYGETLNWQWNEVLIPYWKEAVKIAASYGVTRIALEMHPGFCVYNPETLLKLRAAVGDAIGANFDPSHLIWQNIDPVAALKALKGAVYHFHAKDTRIDRQNCAVNGVLDTKTFSDMEHRSWLFRTVGYGMEVSQWKEMLSTLALIGFDRAVCVEHEDGLMSVKEGLEKAVSFLQRTVLQDPPTDDMFWA